jgi:pimeloyl-ACP methyl ester carboxylesterase
MRPAATSRRAPATIIIRMSEAQRAGDLVVLVHGLWMGATVWLPLSTRLRRDGWRVAAFSYPSWRESLEQSARALAAFVRGHAARRLHFVGHSQGGLVILRMLRDAPQLAAGRVVLIGSPVAGSRAVEQLGATRVGRWLRGTALPQWEARFAEPVLRRLEVGAIAGTRRFGLAALVARVPAPADGAVAVDETRLPGLADHLCLPLSHSGLIVSRRVAAQTAAFLRTGRFTGAG